MSIGVGIAGYGLSGAVFHAPLIGHLDEFKICSIMSSRTDEIAQDFPGARAVSDFASLLANPNVDVVVLGLPNYLHFDYAKQALEAGKHVVVEKPFVPNSADGARLIKIAAENNRILTVFHNRRFDADFLTIKKLIDSGDLGKINFFESHFDRFKSDVGDRWKEQDHPGGGILYDLGAHLIDQALDLFGKPASVFADISSDRNGAINDDYFHLVFKYPELRVVLHASMLCPFEPFRYLIHGSKASFHKSGIDPQEDRLKNRKSGLDMENIGDEDPNYYGFLAEPSGRKVVVQSESGDYLRFYRNLARAISKGEELEVSAGSANAVIEMIEYCKKSVAEKVWVNL